MKFNLTDMKLILENPCFALYKIGQSSDTIMKGVRVNKKTDEHEEVRFIETPKIRVIEIINQRQK